MDNKYGLIMNMVHKSFQLIICLYKTHLLNEDYFSHSNWTIVYIQEFFWYIAFLQLLSIYYFFRSVSRPYRRRSCAWRNYRDWQTRCSRRPASLTASQMISRPGSKKRYVSYFYFANVCKYKNYHLTFESCTDKPRNRLESYLQSVRNFNRCDLPLTCKTLKI